MCCCEGDYEAEREAESQADTVKVLAALLGLNDVTSHDFWKKVKWTGLTGATYEGRVEDAGLTFQVHGRWGWLAADGTLMAYGYTLDTKGQAHTELIDYVTSK